MVLELILAQAPHSKTVQGLAAQYGVDVSRFTRPTDEQVKPGSCIMCSLCVRTCEAVGPAAITTVNRGTKKAVDGPPTGVESCIGCGSCARVCPTDHIVMKDTRKSRIIWNREFPLVACDLCGAPVVTESYKEFAVNRRALPADYYTTCEDCKRKSRAERFATVGA
jgi:formate hydrogenlyase subunit 6/NADH:ubiquinone oxidoreductase subunit I